MLRYKTDLSTYITKVSTYETNLIADVQNQRVNIKTSSSTCKINYQYITNVSTYKLTYRTLHTDPQPYKTKLSTYEANLYN